MRTLTLTLLLSIAGLPFATSCADTASCAAICDDYCACSQTSDSGHDQCVRDCKPSCESSDDSKKSWCRTAKECDRENHVDSSTSCDE